MMMEVERREAIIREQARLLTVQADRMRMEQEHVIRPQVVPSNGISSSTLEQAWIEDGEAGGYREAHNCNGRAADEGGNEANEKVKLERMFEQMEKARKEELEKAVAVKKGTSVICDKTGRRVGSAGEKYKKVDARYPEGTSPDVKAR